MPNSNRFSLLLSLVLLALFPFVFGQFVVSSLEKLHFSAETAFQLMIAIIVGGLINIPVKRIAQPQPVSSHPLAVFGLDRTLPRLFVQRRETVIAVNVGAAL